MFGQNKTTQSGFTFGAATTSASAGTGFTFGAPTSAAATGLGGRVLAGFIRQRDISGTRSFQQPETRLKHFQIKNKSL